MDRCLMGLTEELGGAQEPSVSFAPKQRKTIPSGRCVQPPTSPPSPPPRLSYSPGRISTQGDLALGVLVLAAALAQPQFFILHQGEANAIVAGAGALGALVPSSVPSYLAQNEVKPKQE